MDNVTAIFAARIPGPFRPYGPGAPHYYESAQAKAAHLVAKYRARRARGMGAAQAFRDVLRLAPVYAKGGLYRSPWARPFGAAGAPFTAGGGYRPDVLRFVESTEAAGLRFIGWADELPGGPDHTGWYFREDCDTGETFRGGVWQWPGGRIVYGYSEHENRREMNPGAAAICVSHITRASRADLREHDSARDLPDVRDAAGWADGLAQSRAEDSREYDSAYQAGRRAAERIAQADESRADAIALLAEMRRERKAAQAERPAICRALRERLDSILADIRKARRKRESAWADCRTSLEEAFRAGYCDESGREGWNRWARGLRLSRFAGEPGNGLLPA